MILKTFRELSFVSSQFTAFHLGGWFRLISKEFVIVILLLIIYILFINSSSISDHQQFFSFFWRYISFLRYFFIMLICKYFWIILLWRFLNFRNSISNFITNQITKCISIWLNWLFETVLSASFADCLAWSRNFWLYYNLRFYLYFYKYFCPYF